MPLAKLTLKVYTTLVLSSEHFPTFLRPTLSFMRKRGEIADLLKAELDRMGYGAISKLARFLDMQPRRVWNYVSGRTELPEELIPSVADFFGKTVDQFLGVKSRQPAQLAVRELSTPMYPVGFSPVMIRLLPSVPCGNWEDPTDTEDFIEVDAKFEHPKRHARRVSGDSCSPVLEQGDLAIFHEDSAPPYGTIVLARRSSDNAVTVKKLVHENGRPRLLPINPAYAVDDKEHWEVAARLVGIVRNQDDGTEASFYNPRGIRR